MNWLYPRLAKPPDFDERGQILIIFVRRNNV
jgi:hypothetical protein